MTFDDAQSYLLGLIDETQSQHRGMGLDRMRAFLRALGDPQEAYPKLHVGGTSGKGSTATMLAAALAASGRKTGLHTKPHLHSMTERACVDGIAVSPQRFADLLETMMPAIESVAATSGRPTYYETLLALAFLHFARERVDVAVIEVGLGGRLDGTNVIVPEVAVITSVGYDHTDVLGDTIEAIALEKAGIAKRDVPLVVGAERPEAIAVIRAHARDAGAPVIMVDDVTEIAPLDGDERHFEIVTKRARYDIRLPIFGTFQRRNARIAVAALEALPDSLRPNPAEVERGLGRVAMPGRMEIVRGEPTVVLDIAHNVEKAEHLASSVRQRFPQRRIRAVVAIGAGKDAHAILEALAPLVTSLVVTSFHAAGRKPLPTETIANFARRFGMPVCTIDDPREALDFAIARCAPEDVLVVTGSTFVVAAVRHRVLERAARVTIHG